MSFFESLGLYQKGLRNLTDRSYYWVTLLQHFVNSDEGFERLHFIG